jgi:hypothetical protein
MNKSLLYYYEWLLDILKRIKDCKTCELDSLLPVHWRKPEKPLLVDYGCTDKDIA